MDSYRQIELTMPDGYRCFGRHWRHDRPEAAVLYLHGIQSHGGWFEGSCQALYEHGLDVLLIDRRGSGRNEQNRGDVPNAGCWLRDVRTAARFLLDRIGGCKIHVVGVSWGGKLAAAFYRFCPDLVASLTLIAPGLFPQVDISFANKLAVAATAMLAPTTRFAIPLNEPQLFTENPARQQFIRDDPLRLMKVTSRFLVNSRRLDWFVRNLADRPIAPTMLFLAGKDRIIDNTRTIQFYRSLRTFEKSVCYYPCAGHTLEFEADNTVFLRDLCQWLQRARRLDG